MRSTASDLVNVIVDAAVVTAIGAAAYEVTAKLAGWPLVTDVVHRWRGRRSPLLLIPAADIAVIVWHLFVQR